MLMDQGSVFLAAEWRNAYKLASISLSHTGAESYNYLGVRERFHGPLRKIYRKLQAECNTLSSTLLCPFHEGLEQYLGPDGLVLSLLVFGILPQIPNVPPKIFPSQTQLKQAMSDALREYQRSFALLLINTASRRKEHPRRVTFLNQKVMFTAFEKSSRSILGRKYWSP
jgi:hypothetical protein